MKDVVQVYRKSRKVKLVVWTRFSLGNPEASQRKVSNLPLVSNFNVSVSSRNSSFLQQKKYLFEGEGLYNSTNRKRTL